MSKSIKVDENNNIIFGENFLTCEGNEALVQDIRNLLNLWLGEYPFDFTIGVDYLGMLRSNNLEILISQIQDIINTDSRVSSSSVSYDRGGLDDEITLNIKINTKEGDVIYV